MKSLTLTPKGESLLQAYGTDNFNIELFRLMESKSNAFRYIIERMYKANIKQPGLLIFPIYSPNQLQFERSTIQTTSDIREYADKLVRQLDSDINKYLGQDKSHDLEALNETLFHQLFSSGIIPEKDSEKFLSQKYNAIVSRFRKFWLNFFLKEIYEYELSLSAFDIWIYRGKQIGIIQATESYPNFHGRIVYPTSVLVTQTNDIDFKQLYEYPDGIRLYANHPEAEDKTELEPFVDSLVKWYLSLRRATRYYFISLASLRELVCYNLRISEMVFAKLLNRTYQLNMAGTLKIRISLEVDKLPEETKAVYQKQDPVMIDGKFRNIIAIDVTKGEK